MKKKIRFLHNEKGVTMITLAITIAIMLVLIGVSIGAGMDVYRQSRITKFVAQMQVIQKKVDMIATEGNADEYETEKITERGDYYSRIKPIMDGVKGEENVTGSDIDFKYFSADDMKDKLDIDNLSPEESFAINFKTREIISLRGVEYEETKYYTQYNGILPNGQKLVVYDDNKDLSFKAELRNFGLNSKIIVKDLKFSNLKIRYKPKDAEDEEYKWNIIENYAEKGKEYEITITKSGTYIVMVETSDGKYESTAEVNVVINNAPKITDEMTPINYKGETITKDDSIAMSKWNYSMIAPFTSNDWAYCKIEDKTYMWIPRLAYNGTKYRFLKGNSRVPTDGATIDETWTVPEEFEKYTGIWIQVTEGINNRNSFSLINIFTNGTFLTGRDIKKVI